MRIRFDRGTLVLEPEGDGEDPSRIPEATWDRELLAWRAPADRHADVLVRLSDAGVRISDDVRPQRIAGAWSLPALRWYQAEALARWQNAGRRGVIALPTGSGKTVVALAAIQRLGLSTLVLVPTRVLLDQWANELARTWGGTIGRLGDGEHVIAPITVSTYASATSWAPRVGDRFGLVIVDEAHHVGGWCPREVLEMLAAPARLGLTATPPDDPQARACLARHVGDTVYGLRIEDLAGDALASFDLVTLPIELAPEERDVYREQRARFARSYASFRRVTPEATWREFVRSANQTKPGREALAAWRASRALVAYPAAKRAALRELLARHRGERTIVFTSDNATAYAIARELLIMPITHEIGRVERAAALARFRSGEVPVLVSSQVLEEGLDVPDADVAIIVGGTASARRHVQRIGRVLRPRDGKRARVYELAVEDSLEVGYVMRRRSGLDRGASTSRAFGGAP
ncbi:MAG TPA: DEAD/DEAH box helicase family protein [Kofleriaceae bacterium]|jgi:superfamily II DNA or RNA helicase|nr:DEAD/DEAH box helicase family protein [Kofleriaceae bacterium]